MKRLIFIALACLAFFGCSDSSSNTVTTEKEKFVVDKDNILNTYNATDDELASVDGILTRQDSSTGIYGYFNRKKEYESCQNKTTETCEEFTMNYDDSNELYAKLRELNWVYIANSGWHCRGDYISKSGYVMLVKSEKNGNYMVLYDSRTSNTGVVQYFKVSPKYLQISNKKIE